jgi:uncharacterized protein YjdB
MENKRSNSKVTIIIFVIVFVVGVIAGFLLVRGFFQTNEEVSDTSSPMHIAVESVQITNPDITLNVGGSTQLITAIYPSNASVQSVLWTVDTPAIATVSESGFLTALAVGTAIVTVATNDGNFSATKNIMVTATPITTVPITAIDISGGKATIKTGERLPLTVTFTPREATPVAVTWNSSNANIATVANTGSVVGILPGTTVITVRTADGNFTATLNLTVEKVEVASINITGSKTTIGSKETITLTATVLPANATFKNIVWASNNENVATVNSSGVVVAKSSGNVTITATSTDNNQIVGQYSLRVDRDSGGVAITKITIVGEDRLLSPKGTLSLSVNIEPEAAKEGRIVWTSNNTNVATVVDGLVTAVGAGVATITATSLNDGNVFDMRTVRVDR